MGAVYEAWDLRLERRVALKMLHPHLTVEQLHKDRLLREARLAARVEHPGVVRVYSIHEHEGGLALEMQFVVGTPLHRLLQTRPLSPVQAADLLRQVLEALAACHAQGVIHCDLKPGNLLITQEGTVLLTDFGISRALYSDSEAPIHISTLSGPLWGTPQYSPPEAWDGGMPTPSWDLYALGVLVHEGLAGALPFHAHTPAVLMREKLERTHDSILEKRADLSAELAGLIDALKSIDPDSRPPNAEAALQMLRAAPELQLASAATQPFHHTPTQSPRAASLSLASPNRSIYPTLATGDAAPQGRQWRLHAAWITVVVVAVALALAGGHYVSRQDTPAHAVIPARGEVGQVMDFFVADNSAYFSYDDGFRGRELWRVNPSGRVEIIADINLGPGSSNPRYFMARPSGGILFSATTPELGEEPWYCTSGITPTARLVRDIVPGAMSSEPYSVAAWDSTFAFYATTLQYGTELWVSNSRAEQTGILKDLLVGSGSSTPRPLRFVANDFCVYFVGANGSGWYMWQYTHRDNMFQNLGEINEYVGEMIIFGDRLIFGYDGGEKGFELWVHQPGDGDVHLLADLWEGPESSEPSQFFVWKDALYFQAATRDTGKELWKSDGTPSGTRQLANIAPGTADGAPYGFVPTDDLLFFRANDLARGHELFVTDGTTEGTRLVFDLRAGFESSNPYNIAAIGENLFFTADDGVHGEELWVLDLADIAKRPRLVRDLWPGPVSAEPHNLAATSTDSGIFVYKTPDGDALMRIKISGDDIQMEPCSGLILER
jgi:ELWxxDGT repeat protein